MRIALILMGSFAAAILVLSLASMILGSATFDLAHAIFGG